MFLGNFPMGISFSVVLESNTKCLFGVCFNKKGVFGGYVSGNRCYQD